MAISLSTLFQLAEMGVLSADTRTVVDIGSSNLQLTTVDDMLRFVQKFKQQAPDDTLRATARRMAEGSGYTREHGGVNRAWVGELLELCGMRYTAFDISEMYNVELFDLNTQSVPEHRKHGADLVLNFGTTEHVFNQYNAFQVIHDLCKPGGYIVHHLPASGFCDHGYFQYTGRFMFEMCAINKYELVFADYGQPAKCDLYWSAKQYAEHFTALEKFSTMEAVYISSYCLLIIFRKNSDNAFQVAMETSTSVNKNISIQNPAHIASKYVKKLLSRIGLYR